MLFCADAFPMYDMIEYQLVKHNIPNGGFSRVLYRVIYCMVTAFVAITIPFFGALLVTHKQLWLLKRYFLVKQTKSHRSHLSPV